MRLYFFTIILFLILPQTYGQEYCENFHAFACSDERKKIDGTGSLHTLNNQREILKNINVIEKKRFAQEFDKSIRAKPDIMRQISNALQCSSTENCPRLKEGIQELSDFTFYRYVSNAEADNHVSSKDATALVFTRASMKRFVSGKDWVNQLVSQAFSRIGFHLVPLEKRNQIKDNLFPTIQEGLRSLTNRLPPSTTREAMLKKIETIQVSMSSCGGRYYLEPNARYYPRRGEGEIEICWSNILFSDSLFTIVRTLSHELAHSIDPCKEISKNAWDSLTECLGRKESGDIPKCSDSNRQMAEFFCDWVSSEIIADLQAKPPLNSLTTEQFAIGMANSYSQCKNEPDSDESTHPGGEKRVNLLVAHPKIRERIGCSNNSILNYCALPSNNVKEVPLGLDETGAVR